MKPGQRLAHKHTNESKLKAEVRKGSTLLEAVLTYCCHLVVMPIALRLTEVQLHHINPQNVGSKTHNKVVKQQQRVLQSRQLGQQIRGEQQQADRVSEGSWRRSSAAVEGLGGGERDRGGGEVAPPEAEELCSTLTAELLVAVGHGGLLAAGVQQQLRQPVHWKDRRHIVRQQKDR